jgi:hypothetical protein
MSQFSGSARTASLQLVEGLFFTLGLEQHQGQLEAGVGLALTRLGGLCFEPG